MRMSLLGSASNRAFGFMGKFRPQVVDLAYMIAGGGGYPSGGGWGGVGGGVVLLGTFINYSTLAPQTATVGLSGYDSSFNGLTANAGIQRTADYGSSIPGYSSGGNSATWGWDSATYTIAGGGGAGMGGSGGGGAVNDVYGQHQPVGGDGGPGILWDTTNGGTGERYGAGSGGMAYSPISGVTTTNGSNGAGYGNPGSAGSPGGVIVSYASPIQLFSGGSVTSTGSGSTTRWFHTLANANVLAPLY